MPTYYYLAVASSDNKRTAGKIDSDTEAAARAELNRMGFSILALSQTPLASETTANVFEFEAAERTGKVINGTIEAEDTLAAFIRLTDEFHFTVSYLSPADATDEQKAAARAAGIQPILAEKAARAETAYDTQRMSLKGSLGDLVKRAEEKIKKQPLADEPAGRTDIVEHTGVTSAPVTAISTGPYPWGRVYVLLNEWILPPAGKTRAEAVAALANFYECNIAIPYLHRITHEDAHLALADEAWHVIRAATGILTIGYFAFFAVGQLAARYTWGGVSELAETSVVHSTLIGFLALAFLAIYLVTVARDHFDSRKNLRAGTLLAAMSFALVILGLNVVY